MIKKQFTLYLENRPGALANVLRRVVKDKINVDGISVSETTDVGLVQMVVSDVEKMQDILDDLEAAFTIQDVVVLKLRNAPGVLYEGVAKLAKAGVNINYIYSTGCACAEDCERFVVISAPDLQAVEQAWSM